jgi:hypothetical protein
MTLTPNTKTHEAAYVMQIWSYGYAPIEYRNLFPVPPTDRQCYVVYQRKIVSNWGIEWIAPNSTWWILWHEEQAHDLDQHTTVYLLMDKLRG